MTDPIRDDWFFHYTTAAGFQGILAGGGFWATDANYLNDFKEIQVGVGYAREWLDRNRKSLTDTYGKDVVVRVDNNMQPQPGRQSGRRMFVCSFSANGDSLSQWRAYGEGGGYAIGIHGSHLRKKAKQLGLAFEKCVYDHDELDNPVVAFLDSLLKGEYFSRLAAARQTDPHTDLLPDLCNGVMRNSIILKGKAFAEECEWRLFPDPALPLRCKDPQQFRIRNGVFVPFVKFRIFPDGENEKYLRISNNSQMPVLTVVIGPTAHKELAWDGLAKMLWQLQYEYRFLSPGHSDASYRDW